MGPRFPAASGGDFWAVWNSAGPWSLVPLWSAGVSDLTGVISAGVFVASTSHLAGRQGFTRFSFLLGLPYHRTYGDGFAFLRDKAGEKLILLEMCQPRYSQQCPWWGHSPRTQVLPISPALEAGLSFAVRIGGVGLPWREGNADSEPPPAPLFQRGRCCRWAQDNPIQTKSLVFLNVGTGQVTDTHRPACPLRAAEF